MSGVLDNQIASTFDCDGLGLCRRHGRGIYGSMARLGFQAAGDRTSVHAKVCKHTVLSAASVCRFSLYASERAALGYWYLAEYQRLSYAVNMLVPVRCSFDKL